MINKTIATIGVLFLSTSNLFASEVEKSEIKKDNAVVIKESSKKKEKIYQYTDSQGVIHFTDDPTKGGKEVKIKPLPVTQNIAPKKLTLPKLKPQDEKKEPIEKYTTLSFISPVSNSIVRNNSGTVNLSVLVEPDLKKEHSLRFFLDGHPINSIANSLSITLDKISYGEHSASFIILDTEGKQIQSSETIKFHLLNRINIKNR